MDALLLHCSFMESPLVKTVYLIEDHPSHSGRAEANKNPRIINFLLMDEEFLTWAVDQTDNVVQLLLTKLNHNYDAKWAFNATSEMSRLQTSGALRRSKNSQCTNEFVG